MGSTYYGIEWEKSVHGYSAGAWTGETITVELREPNTVPGAPTGLTVTEGHHAVKLDWTAPAAAGGSAITGYEVGPTGSAAFRSLVYR